ncbi:hypothetical protein [Scytonema sp. PRP1]|uniref:hypothetical protein n=1 Tax=Scytonema sp. PRP1 TaxID=3120513 RepID=UPI002FCF9523
MRQSGLSWELQLLALVWRCRLEAVCYPIANRRRSLRPLQIESDIEPFGLIKTSWRQQRLPVLWFVLNQRYFIL